MPKPFVVDDEELDEGDRLPTGRRGRTSRTNRIRRRAADAVRRFFRRL